jgi:(hydroxyamino)benzene mutase
LITSHRLQSGEADQTKEDNMTASVTTASAMSASTRQTLLVSGALLFLIGLLSGVAIPLMRNPRMGLSAHLTGVQNALVLLVIAALWEHVALPQRFRQLLCWLGIASLYGFWIALQLAAFWGTSGSTPIAGAGFEGLQWQETVVTLLLRGSAVALIVAALLLLAGFMRRGTPQKIEEAARQG